MKGIVSSGTRRSAQLPNVPTCTEAGLAGFCSMSWHAIVAPARTPKTVIARLNQTLATTLSDSALRDQLLAQEDSDPVGGTPEALARLLRTESDKWGRIIQAIGVKGE